MADQKQSLRSLKLDSSAKDMFDTLPLAGGSSQSEGRVYENPSPALIGRLSQGPSGEFLPPADHQKMSAFRESSLRCEDS